MLNEYKESRRQSSGSAVNPVFPFFNILIEEMSI